MKPQIYNKEETKLFKKLSTPAKIQDYLNSLPFNFEEKGDTCMSPRRVMREKKAHCMEGAIFAAAALEFHGGKPLILDLRATTRPFDYDHVVTVFRKDGFFGSISKTNHGVLRYREPIYKSVRELVMSFFHEYFLHNGVKTLREYSDPFDLSGLKVEWRTSLKDLFDIPEILDQAKHSSILTPKQIKGLRKADPIEREMGKIVEYMKKR